MADDYVPWWVPADHPARQSVDPPEDLLTLANAKIKALEARVAELTTSPLSSAMPPNPEKPSDSSVPPSTTEGV